MKENLIQNKVLKLEPEAQSVNKRTICQSNLHIRKKL